MIYNRGKRMRTGNLPQPEAQFLSTVARRHCFWRTAAKQDDLSSAKRRCKFNLPLTKKSAEHAPWRRASIGNRN